MTNPDFYPTPNHLIERMWKKVDKSRLSYVLEPQAGDGAIAEYVKKSNYNFVLHVIEKDPRLCEILRGKDLNLIDYDFLTYSGMDKYDLIIMNPPFSNGDEHLLKAIDILYSGQIVCLLNAETLRNPYTNSRKDLITKLKALNAEIEFIQDAFLTAERKTPVEIALIYIDIKRDIKTDLFIEVENARDSEVCLDSGALVSNNKIEALVTEFEHVRHIVTETILGFYRNHRDVSKFIDIEIKNKNNQARDKADESDLTQLVKTKLNIALKNIRIEYWRKLLDVDFIEKKLTKKKMDEFNANLQKNSLMDFSEANVRTFVVNLAINYEKILAEAVMDLFDRFTVRSAYHEEFISDNIHYFNGWKTNKAFYVNKRLVINMGYGAFVEQYSMKSPKPWRSRLDWALKWDMDDFDKVCNYFDGRKEYTSLYDAIVEAFRNDQYSDIESTYFIAKCHKKGTMHIRFKDDDILRRFNVMACRGKGWLPQDYGSKKYSEMTNEEKAVVEEFEGRKPYELKVSNFLFHKGTYLQIAA